MLLLLLLSALSFCLAQETTALARPLLRDSLSPNIEDNLFVGKIRYFIKELMECRASNQELIMGIKDVKEFIKKNEEKISEAQRELEYDVRYVNYEAINNAVDDIVELREQMQANVARISEVQTSVTQLAEELTDHRKDVSMAEFVTSIAESISDINVTVASNSDQIASLKEYSVRNDESLVARITSVKEIGDINQEKISQVQASVNLLSKDVTNITDKVSRVERQVDNLDDGIESLAQTFMNVKANVKGNSANITDLSADVIYLTSSNQKQEILIENNMQRLNDISKQAKRANTNVDIIPETPQNDISKPCSTLDGTACVFPFTFDGVEYYQCTYKNSPVPWCATKLDTTGTVFTWGNCANTQTSACPVEDLTKPACTAVSGSACIFPFG